MSQTIPQPFTWAQVARLAESTPPAVLQRLGSLPNEVLDNIFKELTSQELYPFLFDPWTGQSALFALCRNPIRIVPTTANAANIFRTLHDWNRLRRIRPWTEHFTRIMENPNLTIAFPRPPWGDWYAGTSYETAFNRFLEHSNHWTNVSLQLSSGHRVLQAGQTWFGNLRRLELVGNRLLTGHLCSLDWTNLWTSHRYELVLKYTWLSPALPFPPPTTPFLANRVRVLTIQARQWRGAFVSRLQQIYFPHLEELSLSLENRYADASGLSFVALVMSLLPSKEVLRKLSFRGAFTHQSNLATGLNRVLQAPLQQFQNLQELELPLAHMRHIASMLDNSPVVSVTFGIYLADSFELDMLNQLRIYLQDYYKSGCQFEGTYSRPMHLVGIQRTIRFQVEIDLANNGANARAGYCLSDRLADFRRQLDRTAGLHGQYVRYTQGRVEIQVGNVVVDLGGLQRLVNWNLQDFVDECEEAFGDFIGLVGW